MPNNKGSYLQSIYSVRSRLIHLYWKHVGKHIRNPEMPKRVRAVLFVCRGNVCRSAFAEGYFSRFSNARNPYDVCSRSAGIDVRRSDRSPEPIVRVAGMLDVDLRAHRSKPIVPEMIAESDMIFAMEHRQAVVLRKTYPNHRSKIFLLPLFDKDKIPEEDHASRFNIPDPYGKSEGEIIKCFHRIAGCIERIALPSERNCR